MKRILINATHNEEIRVALCKDNHLYDFDLENRTREQKKANIYKGHVTRVEPSLEAVFVEYGSQRQGFLPIREIANEYLSGNPRDENIKKLIKEGDELIVQVEKEERGNKGAALSTYVSLAGRYLVLMPNNPRGGGISRQISGKLREDMKRMLGNLELPKGMSVIIRTAGIGKSQEELQHDLNHLLNIWNAIQEQNKKYASPRLVHQEAGVVTRAVRDYLRDDISEIWIDNENAYNEAANFVKAVMPRQIEKLRKYTDYEPMFANFGIEKQIETAYQREVRLPSGGSIVIDQTEALVSIDINSAKSTKGSDVAETAYHTNLEAADEIARQLRLRDMGGLIVIDFIDMNDSKHQRDVEKRLIDATKYDRARVQFGGISKFGLMEMSRQRLRPSLEESTGYICPRCHGNGMIRDLRSLSLSIMRQIEQIALKERQGEVQAEVPTDIAAFLLNEKRDSLVYLEQDSGTRITILPHAHLESPNFKLHFNRDGFAPSSYERISDTHQQESSGLGYDVNWQTAETERPEQQPVRQPSNTAAKNVITEKSATEKSVTEKSASHSHTTDNSHTINGNSNTHTNSSSNNTHDAAHTQAQAAPTQNAPSATQPTAVAWLSNLFAPSPQAQTAQHISSQDAAQAIESIVNTGAQSLGVFGQVSAPVSAPVATGTPANQTAQSKQTTKEEESKAETKEEQGRRQRKTRQNSHKSKTNKPHHKSQGSASNTSKTRGSKEDNLDNNVADASHSSKDRSYDKSDKIDKADKGQERSQHLPKRSAHSKRDSRGSIERLDTITEHQSDDKNKHSSHAGADTQTSKSANNRKTTNTNEVSLQVSESPLSLKEREVVHLSLDDVKTSAKQTDGSHSQQSSQVGETTQHRKNENNVEPKLSPDNETTKTSATDAEQEISKVVEHKANQAKNPDATEQKNTPVLQDQVETATKQSADKSTLVEAETKPQVNDSGSVAAKTDAISQPQSQVEQPSPTEQVKPAQQPKQPNSQQSEPKSEVDSTEQNAAPTLSYDVDALFANRYAAAKQYGKASNDPRVVRATHADLDTNEQSESTKQLSITGNVGDFIHATLPDAQTQIAEQGVVLSFIAALNYYQAGLSSATQAASSGEPNKPLESFSNYGYQPLQEDYLSQFAKMTSAAAQFAIGQGKTDSVPAAVGQRAKNDPRGQHPDYVAEDKAKTHSHSDSSPISNDHKEEGDITLDAKSTTAASTVAASINQTVGEMIQHVLGQQGLDLVASNQTEKAFLQALQQRQVSSNTTEHTTDDMAEVDESLPATALASQAQAEAVEQESLHLLEAAKQIEPQAQDSSGPQESTEANKASTSGKTSVESYKSMIENVSEQLLSQTGLLNLTAAKVTAKPISKVPKARTRKPKTEHKKPTQAEQQDSNNDEDNSTSS